MLISDWSSDVCSSDLDGGGLQVYPGSPWLLARSLRGAEDRLTLCELHPEDAETLRHNLAIDFGRDPRIALHHRNGFEALKALTQIGRASGRERVCQYV